jgi:broad specificity phosphatase PhoE
MSGVLPAKLWIIRHGESAANLSSKLAESSGSLNVVLPSRDMDTPLSAKGEAQAMALGRWFAAQDGPAPDIILSSPYHRTRQTLAHLCAAWPESARPAVHFDERLRERERGVCDGLTVAGVKAQLPEQYALRQFIGKFYHRAPGGESWCDVVQRLRGVVENLLPQYAGKRVMIISHEVVIYCLRYIIENMDEDQILAIDAASDLPNCSVTEYHQAQGVFKIIRWAETVGDTVS